ncbi:hypothetical protein OG802_04755 [Streptomyces sp. NBC_00704]|uniref:hypothetical protein n=1 Tax=Streptomyces sp. NBC_00704 TaxID=2975809 RepID=UPI002E35AC56|nr:hypothetical protein [Streptomyces sp. NBC_00704]
MTGSGTAPTTRTARRPVPAVVPAAVLALAAAVTGGCARSAAGDAAPPASSPGWEGKDDQELAMRRAGRALDAVEPEGAPLLDSGMADTIRGFDRTFAGTADGPRSLTLACQAPVPHILTVTLERGTRRDAGEVRCGDREGDRFDVPAGVAFTVRIAPAPLDGIVLWRLNALAPDECEDDVTECAG